jgi:hypothetical protein
VHGVWKRVRDIDAIETRWWAGKGRRLDLNRHSLSLKGHLMPRWFSDCRLKKQGFKSQHGDEHQ